MKVDVKVLNLNKILTNLDKRASKDVGVLIKNYTFLIQNKAKQFAPVKTGDLRRSISADYSKNSKTGYVYTNLEYAPYQEFGTSKMKAQPFMRPAFNFYEREIVTEVKKLYGK